MGSTKIVSPSVSLPLKNALTYVYWKKSDLKSFLAISIKNNSILATLDWDLTKYKIVSDLVDRMFSRQDIYKDDLLYLIEQICDMDDFTHLLRWDDGEEKVKKAKESVNALRKSTEGYFKRKSNEKNDSSTYGLTRYFIDFGDETDFKLWQSYRMDQVQMKFLKNPQHNQVGTYYYGREVVIFASLKKDLAEEDRLNYNDKFLEPALFQWESMANVSAADVEKQQNSEHAYLFIRKVSDENGIVLPFIYVGKGKMTNPRKQVKFDRAKGKEVVTYLYDIVMENELPDYLQYDFGLNKEMR